MEKLEYDIKAKAAENAQENVDIKLLRDQLAEREVRCDGYESTLRDANNLQKNIKAQMEEMRLSHMAELSSLHKELVDLRHQAACAGAMVRLS